MFIISGAQGPDHAIADHVKLHGPGVKDVGFLVPGAAAAYDRAVERGAIPHMAAVVIENDRVRMVQATIKAYGDSPIVSDTTPTIVYGLFMPAVDAISTEDLQTSIEDMHGRGIETIYVPHEYYPEARERRGATGFGLDLEIPAGAVTGFLGPNGAGKTTTFRALLGLTRFDSGDVRVHGYPVPKQLFEVTKKV
ncbi:MAG: ATP-binding cassette domain-containing protein, partial [Actinomycetota bacterium]|nr:ATP-binding cassette domain-containing protein [Actinomycetota bacterium]